MNALCCRTASNLDSRLSAIALKLCASEPTSSSVSTRARSRRFPSPSAEAEVTRLLIGFVKRPTAHTARKQDAMSVRHQAIASRSIERPAAVPSGAGTPTATLQPEGEVRVTEVMRLAPSLQFVCQTFVGAFAGASAAPTCAGGPTGA